MEIFFIREPVLEFVGDGVLLWGVVAPEKRTTGVTRNPRSRPKARTYVAGPFRDGQLATSAP